ncbi:MAG: hypothetical protein H0W50_06950 [Parachlamydiaceae bacterium]|nr:hypothetical protein [Parachlamydiaceae bacterium]
MITMPCIPYRGLGTGVRRALQDWPQIQFIDHRNGCLKRNIQKLKSLGILQRSGSKKKGYWEL